MPEIKLMATYSGYSSAAAYLSASDDYKALVQKRDDALNPSKYPATLEQMLALENDAADANLRAKAVYLNGAKFKNSSNIETAN